MLHSSDWASHKLQLHISPTDISGPWPYACLSVGAKVIWLGQSPTWFCHGEFGQVVGAVIDIQAHFHSSFWWKDGFLAAEKIHKNMKLEENFSSCQLKNRRGCTNIFYCYQVCCLLEQNSCWEHKTCTLCKSEFASPQQSWNCFSKGITKVHVRAWMWRKLCLS